MACYYGNSDQMLYLKNGKLSDTGFINGILQEAGERAKSSAFTIALKPTAAGDMGRNLQEMIELLKNIDVKHYYIDTLDGNEKRIFQTISPQEAMAKVKDESGRLLLTKEYEGKPAIDNTRVADRLVNIIFNQDGIYVYKGADIKAGRKFTFIRIYGIASKSIEKMLLSAMGSWPINSRSCIVFVDFSDFDIPIGARFALFAENEDDGTVHKIAGELVQVSQSFLKPFTHIPKGHKTICEIKFDDQSFNLLRSKLPIISSWYDSERRFLLGTNNAR